MRIWYLPWPHFFFNIPGLPIMSTGPILQPQTLTCPVPSWQVVKENSITHKAQVCGNVAIYIHPLFQRKCDRVWGESIKRRVLFPFNFMHLCKTETCETGETAVPSSSGEGGEDDLAESISTPAPLLSTALTLFSKFFWAGGFEEVAVR